MKNVIQITRKIFGRRGRTYIPSRHCPAAGIRTIHFLVLRGTVFGDFPGGAQPSNLIGRRIALVQSIVFATVL